MTSESEAETHVDVQLHVLPLAEPGELVTVGGRETDVVTGVGGSSQRSRGERHASPLYELLEDLPSQAVADLHDVRLQRSRQSAMRGRSFTPDQPDENIRNAAGTTGSEQERLIALLTN